MEKGACTIEDGMYPFDIEWEPWDSSSYDWSGDSRELCWIENRQSHRFERFQRWENDPGRS
jgi:hypothetical protein